MAKKRVQAVKFGAVDKESVCVDAEVAEIVAKGTKTDSAVRVQIALANLEEAAKRAKALEALRDGLAGERVEDYVDADATGEGHYFVREVE